MCGLILYQFLMGTYFLEMNMWCFGWHIPLGCEELVFRLTHNFWLWTCFVHPFVHLFFHPFNPFIHFSFPSIFIFIIGHMAKYSSMSCNILCHVSTKYSKKSLIMLTCKVLNFFIHIPPLAPNYIILINACHMVLHTTIIPSQGQQPWSCWLLI